MGWGGVVWVCVGMCVFVCVCGRREGGGEGGTVVYDDRVYP